MAFKTAKENTASLKLNQIPTGAFVDLYDFKSKKLIAEGAKLIGWKNGKGEVIPAPSVMINAAPDTTITFETYHEDTTSEMVLVKDPNGAGCFFRVVSEKDKPDTLRRVTAYASKETVAAVRASRVKEKAEETAQVSVDVTPQENTDKAKNKTK